jgi:hypothetical protein
MQEHNSELDYLKARVLELEHMIYKLTGLPVELNRNGFLKKQCLTCGGKILGSGRHRLYCSVHCYRSRTKPSLHPLHHTWRGMISRCHNPKDPAYKNYGGRGILVCHEWHDNFYKFKTWAESQDRAPNTTLERKDNNLGYSPDNCTFATLARQQRNRRNTLFFEAFGERKAAADWAEDPRCAVGLITLRHRIRRLGMSPEIAITTPPDNNGATIRRVHKRYKSNSVLLTAFGETKPISEWALDPRCKVNHFTLRRRISKYSMDHETAITSALRKRHNHCAKSKYTDPL